MGLFDKLKRGKEHKKQKNTKIKELQKISGNQKEIKKRKKPTNDVKLSFPLTDEKINEWFKSEMEMRNEMTPQELNEYKKEINEQSDKIEKEQKEFEEYQRLSNIYCDNNFKADELINNNKINQAIKVLEENIKLNADTPHTYFTLASLYHNKLYFQSERDVLRLGLENCKNIANYGSKKKSFEKKLNNVESFLNTGKWEYDCLPSDNKDSYLKIKEAKSNLKDGNEENGIKLLEKIMADGTYNNTVYNTLYQTYNKNKQFDDSIRVCKKAIEVLGLFSNDRKEKWTINLEKAEKNNEEDKNN